MSVEVVTLGEEVKDLERVIKSSEVEMNQIRTKGAQNLLDFKESETVKLNLIAKLQENSRHDLVNISLLEDTLQNKIAELEEERAAGRDGRTRLGEVEAKLLQVQIDLNLANALGNTLEGGMDNFQEIANVMARDHKRDRVRQEANILKDKSMMIGQVNTLQKQLETFLGALNINSNQGEQIDSTQVVTVTNHETMGGG